MAMVKKALPPALFLFIAVVILYPNPFGNNPDIILDESYFLTSSLASIEKHTLPGWEFSPSGAYYGGIQTYVDTAVLIPVVASVVIVEHFSLSAAKLWVAINTGELLHILRLVSGATALGAILFCFFLFKKRKVPQPLALTLTLFLFLLLSNVLVIEFLHTAKMWAYYIIFVALTSAFFIAQEYYLAERNEEFFKRRTYVALMVWSVILTFFQSFVGAFSVGLLMLYSYLLGHFTIRDVWQHVAKYWYLIALVCATQVSFLYRLYMIRESIADESAKTLDGSIDWFPRLVKPLIYAIEGHPLFLLFPIVIVALIIIAARNKQFFSGKRKRSFLILIALYPVFTYLFFHLIVGFDVAARYGIPLTLAGAFSVAILLGEIGKGVARGVLVIALALFALIGVHAISLYWQPSSESVLLDTIKARFNSPDTIFITDHSARRMTLPVNYASLALLDEERQAMSRFAFLLQNREQLAADTSFKPLTITAYRDEQMTAALARFATSTNAVWVISRDCTARCAESEASTGRCFEINTKACGLSPQEVNTLPVFLASDQLGYSYIVRKVR
ncbi:MAG TPA: hypothetical protein VJG64_02785 [Candidatus Paceibacterota bacterium]